MDSDSGLLASVRQKCQTIIVREGFINKEMVLVDEHTLLIPNCL